MPGTLYLIPAPLADFNWSIPENLKVLVTKLRFFATENARTARRQLRALDPALPLREIRFLSLDDELPEALNVLQNAHDVGVMSEAGCPGVADPGAKLVALAHENKVRVVPLPGPSAILLALMASGMNGQRFAFRGYLPVDKSDREAKIEELERESRERDETQIFIETPYRNQAMLESLLISLLPATRICLATDLNSSDETIRTDTVEAWRKSAPQLGKRPTVFLISASAQS
jgi:16S rRNA (cytidine1402-2'-O)-methyltransferase